MTAGAAHTPRGKTNATEVVTKLRAALPIDVTYCSAGPVPGRFRVAVGRRFLRATKRPLLLLPAQRIERIGVTAGKRYLRAQ